MQFYRNLTLSSGSCFLFMLVNIVIIIGRTLL